MQILLSVVLFIVSASFSSVFAQSASETPTELNWEALMPKDWKPVSPFELMSSERANQLSDSSAEAAKMMEELNAFNAAAPVVQELDGKLVKLPGFLLPLEFDGTAVKEFLLVPYFGACIHTPPPPANQIVYVKSATAIEVGGMFDPVWVTGKLATHHVSIDIAEAGYSMDAYEVAPYEY